MISWPKLFWQRTFGTVFVFEREARVKYYATFNVSNTNDIRNSRVYSDIHSICEGYDKNSLQHFTTYTRTM